MKIYQLPLFFLSILACAHEVFAQTLISFDDDLSMLVWEDYSVSAWSAANGNIVVGGNLDFSAGGSIGNSSTPGDYTIVAHGDLNLTNVQVKKGSALYGGALSGSGTSYDSGFGAVVISGANPSPYDLAALESQYKTQSTNYAMVADNGSVVVENNGITLTGTEAGLNVFSLSAADLSTFGTIAISAPAGSTVLINVDSANVVMSGFSYDLIDVNGSRVLWNFSNTTSLIVSNTNSFDGSILAPWASLSFSGITMNGQYIGDSFSTSAYFETNIQAFDGLLPSVPEPATYALFLGIGALFVVWRKRFR